MSTLAPVLTVPRSQAWRWWIAGLMMAALVLNYSSRSVVNQNQGQMKSTLGIDNDGYGDLLGRFSLGFAWGGLFWGIIADVVPVRVLFPSLVVGWSIFGGLRATTADYHVMMCYQAALGFLLAGLWPCSLRTTQRLFAPEERTFANTILQSGASLGNVLTPFLVLSLHEFVPGYWWIAFLVVASLGPVWAIAWLTSTAASDWQRPVLQTQEGTAGTAGSQVLREQPFLHLFLQPRWWLLLWVVLTINLLWHYLSQWLTVILEEQHGYSKSFTQWFTAAYYAMTAVGSLLTGWLSARLVRQGWTTTQSRILVFVIGSLMSLMTIVAAWAPRGPLLLGSLLVVAAGSLGLFPVFYSLNQELSARHQGKVGGLLSFTTWMMLGFVHPAVGHLIEQDDTWRPYLLTTVGIAPCTAAVLLLLFWSKTAPRTAAAPEK